MSRTALILGATGGVGSETALALLEHGWHVRAAHRRPDEARRTSVDARIEWVKGDAMDAASVERAAEGTAAIVHAVNPPGYKNWKGLALPMLESTISAARRSGARIVLPGTVYNYGPDAFPRVRETAEQNPRTKKGAIRKEMEASLDASGASVLIVRAGDYFGARAKSSWFSQGLVQPGKPLRRVVYPAKHDVGHQWAYLPDVAKTIAKLLDRASDLARFDTFHLRGHWFERGVDIALVARRVAGVPEARVWPFPWSLLPLLAPFNETVREMREMRYLWQVPVELVNDKLVEFLGEEPHTPLDRAIEATLRGLGCMRDAQLPSHSS